MLFCGYWLNGFLEIGKKLTLDQIFYIGMAFVILFAIILLLKTFKGFPKGFVKSCKSMKSFMKKNNIKKKNLKSAYGYSKNISKELYKSLKNYKNSNHGKPSDYISNQKVLKSRSSSAGFVFGFILYLILSVGVTAFLSISYHNNLNDGLVAGLKLPAIIFGAVFVLGILHLLIRKGQLKKSSKALEKLVKFLDKNLEGDEISTVSTETAVEEPAQTPSETENLEETNLAESELKNDLDLPKSQEETLQSEENEEAEAEETGTDEYNDDLESMLDGMLSNEATNSTDSDSQITIDGDLINYNLVDDEDDPEPQNSTEIMENLMDNIVELSNQSAEEKYGESYKNTTRFLEAVDPNSKQIDARPYSDRKLKEKIDSINATVEEPAENEPEELEDSKENASNLPETENEMTQDLIASEPETSEVENKNSEDEIIEELSSSEQAEGPENASDEIIEENGYEIQEPSYDEHFDEDASYVYNEISREDEPEQQSSEEVEPESDENLNNETDENSAYEFIDALSNDGNKPSNESPDDIIDRINSNLIDLLNGDRSDETETIDNDYADKYGDLLSLESEQKVENGEQSNSNETKEDLSQEIENILDEVSYIDEINNSNEQAEDVAKNPSQDVNVNEPQEEVSNYISSERATETQNYDESENENGQDDVSFDDQEENVEREHHETEQTELNDSDDDSDLDDELDSEFDDILNSVDKTPTNLDESLNNVQTEEINLDETPKLEPQEQNEFENLSSNEENQSTQTEKPVQEQKPEISANTNVDRNSNMPEKKMTYDKLDSESEDSEVYEEVTPINEPYVIDYSYEQYKQEYENKKKKLARPISSVNYLTNINVDPVKRKKDDEQKAQENADGVTLKTLATSEKPETPETDEKEEVKDDEISSTEEVEAKDQNSQDDDIAEIVGKFKDIQTSKGFVPENLNSFDGIATNSTNSDAESNENSSDEQIAESQYYDDQQNAETDYNSSSEDAFETNISQYNDVNIQNLDESFDGQGFNQDVPYTQNSFSDFDDLFITHSSVPRQETRGEENFDEYFNRYASKLNNPNIAPIQPQTPNYYGNGYNQYPNQNPYGYNPMQNNMYNQGYFGNNGVGYDQNNGYYNGQNMYGQNSNFMQNQNMQGQGFNNAGYPNGYYQNQQMYQNNMGGVNQGYYQNNQPFMPNQNNQPFMQNQNMQGQGFGNAGYPNGYQNQNFGQNMNNGYGNLQNQNNQNANQNPQVQNNQNSNNVSAQSPAKQPSVAKPSNTITKVEDEKPVQEKVEVQPAKTENIISALPDKSEIEPKKVQEVVKEEPAKIEQKEQVKEEPSKVETSTKVKEESETLAKAKEAKPKKTAKKAKETQEKPSSEFAKKQKETVEEQPEKKSNRGRPKSTVVEDDFEITSDEEFEKTLAKAEKLTRKKESNLSETQAKRVESELEKLMKALNKYRNKE